MVKIIVPTKTSKYTKIFKVAKLAEQMRRTKLSLKQFQYGEKGFTLIELLIVVAILGILAAVAVPNVTKFIGTGKAESFETELHNVQIAVIALLADSQTNQLADAYTAVSDLGEVEAVSDKGIIRNLSEYMSGLNGTEIKSGCTYDFTINGVVSQNLPE